MGKIITITGANYVNNVNDDLLVFDVLSANAQQVIYVSSTNQLSLKNGGASGNYNYAADSLLFGATITAPSGAPISANTIVIGTTTTGGAVVLYLDGTGKIAEFPSSGVVVSPTVLYTIPSNKPSVAKGSPVTISYKDTYFTISYPTYTLNVNYSSITSWNKKAIGVLATGTTTNTYTFVPN